MAALSREHAVKHPIRFPQRPDEHYPALAGPRGKLTDLLPRHIDVARLVGQSNIYSPDLLVWGFAQRSYGLVDGFLAAFDTWNLHVAGPLVRLQLDSLTRLSYAATCPDMDALAMELLGGAEFRLIKDSSSKRLTDQRLVELAQARHAWLKPVYETASGWVHFSPMHVFLGTQASADELHMRIPLNPETIGERLLAEMLGAMGQATDELLDYLQLWGEHKLSLPDLTPEE